MSLAFRRVTILIVRRNDITAFGSDDLISISTVENVVTGARNDGSRLVILL